MSQSQPIYFNPDGDGLEVFLGPTEARAMEIIWREQEATAKKVLALWPEERKPAGSTILTILSKLTKKGLLDRHRDGRHFVYTPTISREEFLDGRLKLVAGCITSNFRTQFKKLLA